MEKNHGKITVLEGNKKYVLQGSIEYCKDLLRELGAEVAKVPSEKTAASPLMNDTQSFMLYGLSKENRAIVECVVEFHKKNGEYPTPIKIKKELDERLGTHQINYYTRRIAGRELSKFLKYVGGNHKGKRVSLTEEFLQGKLHSN